jgi:hypothetical protein
MHPVSENTIQKATTNHYKIHRSRPVIAQKIVAFRELIGLEYSKKSAREAADILEVPNSTMQSWRRQQKVQQHAPELREFLTTPVGAAFLQRNVIAVMKLMKCGPGGIRGMQEYLHNAGLDFFVAASEGALQNFWVRCESHIIEFGEQEEKKLAAKMSHRKITVGLDEMFRARRPCLVAIEVVSNYILVEKFTEDRKAETWKKEIDERTQGLKVTVSQVVSDLCGAIRSCAKTLGAKHIPELFHNQYEISKATSAPLASQAKANERALYEAEEKVKEMSRRPRRLIKEIQARQEQELAEAIYNRDKLKVGSEIKIKRCEDVKASIKEMGKIHHPINFKTGILQTALGMKHRFDEQFKIIRKNVRDAKLGESSQDRIDKAQRAFEAIVDYMKYFFIMYAAFVADLQLTFEQETFFNNVIFPLSYLKMIWRRLPKTGKIELVPLLNNLEIKIRGSPWEEKFKNALMMKGKELAENFQRSSSCVEGRNGALSLNHHRFHRLNEKSLKVLTIVHNFDVQRSDGTTAAERFFEMKHESLFESLVTNVAIPSRPQNQHHDLKKRLAGREKRHVA